MKISVIVCTRNRASRLPRFFEALGGLERPPFDCELVIVNHASTDTTEQVIQTFAADAPYPVRTMHSDAAALSGAKNRAIAVARGEILAFTDDDCYPRPDYLFALADVFARHDVGVIGGRVVLHDPADARVTIRDVETPTTIEPATFVHPGTIHGANLAIRREVIAAIGGFDPLLGPSTPCIAGEDVELVARAVWAGWRARYDPAPVVSHHHGRKGEDADRLRRGYDYGRGAYYTKLLLNRRARRIYLRRWYELTRRLPRPVARQRIVREIAGGRRYLVQRMRHGQSVPRFDALVEWSHGLS
jgi:GT2 family glycosyltransferase